MNGAKKGGAVDPAQRLEAWIAAGVALFLNFLNFLCAFLEPPAEPSGTDSYASLGVPEVWRLDETSLHFHVLGGDREYALAATSAAFPGLTPGDLLRFMAMRGALDETTVVRHFRKWVQLRNAAGWQ